MTENGLSKKNLSLKSGKDSIHSESSREVENGSVTKEDKNPTIVESSDLRSFEIKFGTNSGVESVSKKIGGLGCQELTLSYMCDTSKSAERDVGMNSNSIDDLTIGLGKGKYKGKEVMVNEKLGLGFDDPGKKWDMKEFLEVRADSGKSGSKRGSGNGGEEGFESLKVDKRPKLESASLDLSLGPPNLSLSLNPPNSDNHPPLPQPPQPPSRTRSIQSLGPSRASSDDFTASMSCSYSSYPFSHNPSCSLTRNSTENYELSVSNGRNRGYDQIWNGMEGTNGSVHSRFRPVGGGGGGGSGEVTFNLQNGSLHGDKGNQSVVGGSQAEHDLLARKKVENISFSNNSFPLVQGVPLKEALNSMHKGNSGDQQTFFPLDLPARVISEIRAADAKESGGGSEMRKLIENGLVKSEDGRPSLMQQKSLRHHGAGVQTSLRPLTRPERLINEVVSESVPVMAQIFQELPDESIEAVKNFLKSVVTMPEKRDEFSSLQRRLERRSDLTIGTLSKSNKTQLDILVTVKTGVVAYLSDKLNFPMEELVEVFLLTKCRNVNCRNLLPVDDCDCKICSTKKGFCSNCMCQICLNFDCASNTCSWVGCDVCSHWCHADCGIKMQYIKSGFSVKGGPGTSEMQFHCLGCGHASEMFGFVREVFNCCAKEWGMEALMKELDCVRRVFRSSEDVRGKTLHKRAEDLLAKLDKKLVSPSDACNSILAFLKDGVSESCVSESSAKEIAQTSQIAVEAPLSSPPASTAPEPSYNTNFSNTKNEIQRKPQEPVYSLNYSNSKSDGQRNPSNPDRLVHHERREEPELKFNLSKKDEYDSLESIVKLKEAEARMFQSVADDARGEAESLRQIVRAKSVALEEEYTGKLGKLCLQETEERRQKKLEELKILETAHCDYFKMKMRMEAEIAGLLERMETTKQQWM